MLIVIALGGNALLQPDEPLTATHLIANSRHTASAIAKVATTHQIVLVHGNGPQVGLLALQAEAYRTIPAYPFDILNAESQGMIGYLLQQALNNALVNKPVATLLTQVLVEATDPAFLQPSKPIGPFYQKDIIELQTEHPSWQFQETHQGLRRVVASPEPRAIIELASIQTLLLQDTLVITAGGGGIPCIRDDQGQLTGIAAVIDKDLTASLLAEELHADRLIILTNVKAVYDHWGTKLAQPIRRATIDELANMTFPSGSMGPKITAACRFTQHTHRTASIGHLNELISILDGHSGTHILPGH